VACGGAATAGAVSARRGASRFSGHPRRGRDRPSGGVCGCGRRRRFVAGAPPLRVAVSVPVSTTAGHTAERRPASRSGRRGAPRVGPRPPSRPLRGFGISQTPRRARDRSSGGARGYVHRGGRLDAGAPPVGVAVSVPVTTTAGHTAEHRPAGHSGRRGAPRVGRRAPPCAPAAGRAISNPGRHPDRAAVVGYGNAYGSGHGHQDEHLCPCPSLSRFPYRCRCRSRSPCPELQRWMHRRASAAGQARTPRCSGEPARGQRRPPPRGIGTVSNVRCHRGRTGLVAHRNRHPYGHGRGAGTAPPFRPHTRPRLSPQGGTVRFHRGATRPGGPAPCNSTPFGPSRKTRPVRVGQTRQHALHCLCRGCMISCSIQYKEGRRVLSF